MPSPRRVVVYKSADGWRYRVQARNWRTIAASEEGRKSKTALLNRLEKEYPGVETIVEEPDPSQV